MKIASSLWILAALGACAGYVGGIAPDERELTARATHARTLLAQADTDERHLRRAAELERVKRRVRADLRRLSGPNSESGVTVAALRLFNDEARRFDVDVRTVLPQPRESLASPATSASVIEYPMTLDLRGRFAAIVTMLADLPRHEVLVDLHDVNLTAVAHDNSAPVLVDATIHATLDRVSNAFFSEELPNAAPSAR